MKTRTPFVTMRTVLCGVGVAAVMTGCMSPKGDSLVAQRKAVLTMRDETLATLYADKPIVQEKIGKAAGYAVFSNLDINLLIVSAGNGYGVVHSNATGQDTYMKMGTVGVGLGAGIKDFKAVMLFKSKESMNSFVEEGLEWGASADAAAKAGDAGGQAGAAADVTGDIEIYTITESGIALQATIAGTKYWKDDDLN
jgi:lipid-binding SYLF domain-containing protein